MARCAEAEKSALEKLGKIILAATIDAEGANYVEYISRQLAKDRAAEGNGLQKGKGRRRRYGVWKQPQEFVSGRIPAAEAQKVCYQKWQPVQFPKPPKRKFI